MAVDDDAKQSDSPLMGDSMTTLVTGLPHQRGNKSASKVTALARGSTVGRYVVYDVLGVGGMGVVYKAFDPHLNRAVALKLLALKGSESATKQASARLEREARALAQLSHPNVVAVYDVGRVGETLFLAMELVEGTTLKEWWASAPRTRSEILEVFCAAGRGLAAAHGAGLVHRDFKPGNVLVGNDGRVRVVDFGLVRASESATLVHVLAVDDQEFEVRAVGSDDGEGSELSSGSSCLSGVSVNAPLTRVGAVVGTPQYMAPEQFDGDRVDVAGDQFSFCVALYEALYCERPFAGDDVESLRHSVLIGKVRDPSPDARVPTWLRKILLRGLSLEREDRYPSMDALIADLAADPAVRRRRWLLVATTVASIVLAAAVAADGGRSAPLCDGAAAELNERWNAERRDALRSAFLASAKPYAAALFDRVRAQVDGYGARWVAMRNEACAATHIRGTQSERLLDLRMSCLDRRLDGLTSLVDVMSGSVDARSMEKALPAIHSLPPIDDCADERALTALVALPDDPRARLQVIALRRRMDEARSLMKIGHYAEGLAVVNSLEREADDLAYSPLQAEMHLLVGTLQVVAGSYREGEESLRTAGLYGGRAGDDKLVAEAWLHRIDALVHLGENEQAMQTAPYAETAVVRSGDSAYLRSFWEKVIGDIHYAKRDFQRAFEYHQSALERMKRELGEDDITVAKHMTQVGRDLWALGRSDESRAHQERALAIFERNYGEDHPLVATVIHNLATGADEAHDYVRSERMFARALRSFKNTLGDDHFNTAVAYSGLGVSLYNLGRLAEAEPLLRKSISIREAALGDQHSSIGNPLLALGAVLNRAERLAEADMVLNRALSLFRDSFGDKDNSVGLVLQQLADNRSLSGDFKGAETLFAQALEILQNGPGARELGLAELYECRAESLERAGLCDEASNEYRRALATYEKLLGEDHPKVSNPLAGLARCHLTAGDDDRARPLLERAVGIRHNHPGYDQYRAARMEFDLARTLSGDQEERARALSLARRARAVFESDSRPSATRTLSKVEQWLREHAPGGGSSSPSSVADH